MIEMKYGITFTDQFGDIAYYAVDEEVRAKIEDLCEEYVKQQKAEKGDKGVTENPLREICSRCGCTYGSHHAGISPFPRDYCPGHEGRMDWENGPGTVFKGSGEYKNRISH